jgi:hypothetical protein
MYTEISFQMEIRRQIKSTRPCYSYFITSHRYKMR